MTLTIPSVLLISSISIILSIIAIIVVFRNKQSNFGNIASPEELCEGSRLSDCVDKMKCLPNINCQYAGQPANRGPHPSNSETGNYGDWRLVN